MDTITRGFSNSSTTGINDETLSIIDYKLNQNYPNPFNPTTTISFQLPVTSYVTLKVYDILGNEISSLVDETKSPGSYSISFDGSTLASGMYLYRLDAGNYSQVRKMVLLK
jgi:hypothetical protein